MDEKTARALEALPDVKGGKARVWTVDEDSALLLHWQRARRKDVARLLGVAEDTARERYRFLTRTK